MLNGPQKCFCPSSLFHSAVCALVHPEIAALPTEMPGSMAVSVYFPNPSFKAVQIDAVNRDDSRELIAWITPTEARSLARELLLKADEVDRDA